MPSPFPGIDPFIEGQEWEDFHTRFIPALADAITPGVGEGYLVRVERRIYMEHFPGDQELRIADVAVADEESGRGSTSSATATAVAPVEGVLPMPEEQRESYLVIKDRATKEVVTVIELLSPGNKRPGADGRRQYLSKRESVLSSQTHLVELDLLRGGERLPMKTPLPAGDYYAIVSRSYKRPRAEIWAWSLRGPLPQVAVPLKREDPDVSLDLQHVVQSVYERARYDLSLDYGANLDPALPDPEWARGLIREWAGGERPAQ